MSNVLYVYIYPFSPLYQVVIREKMMQKIKMKSFRNKKCHLPSKNPATACANCWIGINFSIPARQFNICIHKEHCSIDERDHLRSQKSQRMFLCQHVGVCLWEGLQRANWPLFCHFVQAEPRRRVGVIVMDQQEQSRIHQRV